MKAGFIKAPIYARRMLAAAMAAACLCTAGCGDAKGDSYVSISVEATPAPAGYPGVNITYAEEITAYATDSSIYMRARPDKSTDNDNIVKKVENAWAAQFTILGKTDEWYYAQYTEGGVDYRGFVREADIFTGGAAPTPTPRLTPEPTKKPDDKDEDKGKDKDTDKPKATPTPKPKKRNTPYANDYTPVEVKTVNRATKEFSSKANDGSTITNSYLGKAKLTLVYIWSTT